MEHVRISVVSVAVAACILAALSSVASSPAGAASQDTVALVPGTTISLATPPFIVKGKRYAFSWPGGGPPQTFTVKDLRKDGWILVEVAEENVDATLVPFGTLPVRWLNVALATSVQEMRPLLQ